MTLTRREFLQRAALASSGLVLTAFPEFARADVATATGGPFDPNAYLRIGTDDSVTIYVIRHEMGQGVRTLLPMMLAEELEADWSRVRLEQAVTEPRFKGIRLHTSGSGSSRGAFEVMRKAGATARVMLVGAAAARWGVAPETCRAENGAVVHGASGRRLRYGQLAADAAKQAVPDAPPLKTPDQFRLIGKPMKRVDGPEIVTGRAVYGLDVRVPGLVFASIERAPVLGAKLVRFDDAKARHMPGVLNVLAIRSGIQHGVAVVATSTWAALKARGALDIEWAPGRHATFDSDSFEAEVEGWLDRTSFKVRHHNDAPAALAAAAQRHQATYLFPFQAHAPLETMNCTADVRADSAEFWVPSQTQHRSMEQAVKVTGLPEEKIRIRALLMAAPSGAGCSPTTWRKRRRSPRRSGESFLDEMALLAQRDPLHFRLSLLKGGVRQVGPYKIDQGGSRACTSWPPSARAGGRPCPRTAGSTGAASRPASTTPAATWRRWPRCRWRRICPT